ncbi:MAG: zinc-ribbon domain-containing protein [Clostridia bacterium]|nr:zinc-ribbon domain-containing protein [Clostridia bacterium]
MAEWDWEKNEKSPDQNTFGSHRKVWGSCLNGHHYQAIISNRVTSA